MARPQTVLTVVAARRLTPHLVRLTLGGEQFDAVHARWAEKGATDQYVKLLFADPALGLEPPYDLDALRERLAPEQLPVRRTYTVRRMDAAARTMDVDFVVHGASDDGAAPGRDGGLAGAWAASEPVGQQVAFLGPGGAYRPDPTADWHLLAGDEAALPAIAAALEDLAATDAAAAPSPRRRRGSPPPSRTRGGGTDGCTRSCTASGSRSSASGRTSRTCAAWTGDSCR